MIQSWMKDKATLKNGSVDSYGKFTQSDIKEIKCKIIEGEKEIRVAGKKEILVSTATLMIPTDYTVNMETVVMINNEEHKIIKINKEDGRDITGKLYYVVVYVE